MGGGISGGTKLSAKTVSRHEPSVANVRRCWPSVLPSIKAGWHRVWVRQYAQHRSALPNGQASPSRQSKQSVWHDGLTPDGQQGPSLATALIGLPSVSIGAMPYGRAPFIWNKDTIITMHNKQLLIASDRAHKKLSRAQLASRRQVMIKYITT